jgi:hypothetical protein
MFIIKVNFSLLLNSYYLRIAKYTLSAYVQKTYLKLTLIVEEISAL